MQQSIQLTCAVLIIIHSAAFELDFSTTWKVQPICRIFDFFTSPGCTPCDTGLCPPPKIKANVNCQIFTCLKPFCKFIFS